MSITIKNSHDNEIEIGYFGFYRLRLKIAELTAEDICKHYEKLKDFARMSTGEKEHYNLETDKLMYKYQHSQKHLVLDFLYASDCDGSMDAEHCKAIYNVIKDCHDETQYGYVDRAMWDIPATISSFADLLKEAVEDGKGIEWY